MRVCVCVCIARYIIGGVHVCINCVCVSVWLGIELCDGNSVVHMKLPLILLEFSRWEIHHTHTCMKTVMQLFYDNSSVGNLTVEFCILDFVYIISGFLQVHKRGTFGLICNNSFI